MENRLYKAKYGGWAGNPEGNKPDYTRCCEQVSEGGRSALFRQCGRPRGYGPDGAYCKQHDPEAVRARQVASEARYNAEYNKQRYSWYGRTFYDALKQIAEGYNDARGLAQDVLAEFHKGERK